jgi:hypothetical protein
MERRILAPGGRIVLLEGARELYADEWLGFSEINAWIVDIEPETPQFQTLVALGAKPAQRESTASSSSSKYRSVLSPLRERSD